MIGQVFNGESDVLKASLPAPVHRYGADVVPKSAGGSNQRCDINRFANSGKVVRLGGLAELEQGIGQTIIQ